MSRTGTALINQIDMLVDRQIKMNTQTARVVTVSSVEGPVLNDMGLQLPPDTFYISKSINPSDLKLGDRLLLVEVKNDMPVVTDLLRSARDDSGTNEINGDLGVSGEVMVRDTVHAENGIRIKTFSDKSPPVNGTPSDDDFIDPPIGTLALDLAGPTLYVRVAPNDWKAVI